MSDDARALAYLAWRQIVNMAREMLKRPSRVVLWVFVGIALAATVALRMVAGALARGHGRLLPVPGVPEPAATGLFFAYLLLIAVNLWIAASGNAAGFSSEADARFLTLSKIAPRRLLAWLQLRSSGALIVQTLFVSLFYPIIFTWAGEPFPMFLTIVAALLFVAAIRMPVLRASVRFGAAPFATLAVLLGLAGVLGLGVVAAPYIQPSLAPASAYLVHLGFGSTLRAMLAGAPLPILVLWALPLAALALGGVGSTDVLPEVYAASLRAIATAKRNKRGLIGGLGGNRADRYSASPTAVTSARGSRSWRGAFALIWKDWLAFSRSRGAIGRSIALLAGGVAVGAVAGLWTRRGHDPNILVIQAANFAVIFLSLYSSIALNADLGKPLWWLNADTLVARLGAWVVAATWRGAALGTSAVLGCAIAIGSLRFAAIGTFVTVGIVLYLRCIGLALYAMFPSQIDQKGPIAGLRILLAYLFIAPAGIAAGIAGAIASSFVVAGAAAAVVASIECLVLIRFAAGRIRDNGIGIARAEAG